MRRQRGFIPHVHRHKSYAWLVWLSHSFPSSRIADYASTTESQLPPFENCRRRIFEDQRVVWIAFKCVLKSKVMRGADAAVISAVDKTTLRRFAYIYVVEGSTGLFCPAVQALGRLIGARLNIVVLRDTLSE